MPNGASRRVLTVFLASPGDLVLERRAARDIVESINRVLGRRLGWSIDLLGWEDTTPGAGRPQEIINAEVDRSDLVIGLLWRRWGQPTGSHSSGFEEEFERALARRGVEDRPEVFLFFKRIAEGDLDDPGEQLRRVLAFRKARIDARDVLFKEFADLDEFRVRIQEALEGHLLDFGLPHDALAQASPVRPLSQSSPGPSRDGSTRQRLPTDPGDLFEALRSVARNVSAADLPGGNDVLDTPTLVRLYFLASAWISDRATDEFLSSHSLNLAYTYRQLLTPRGAESQLLLRSLLADEHELLPGWYWYDTQLESDLVSQLAEAVDSAPLDAVRQHALEVLAALRTADVLAPEFVERRLADTSEEVRTSMLRLLATNRSNVRRNLVQALQRADTPPVRMEASRTLFLLRATDDPDQALEQLLAAEPRPDGLHELFNHVAQRVRTATLMDSASDTDATVRLLALREVNRRSGLTQEALQGLVDDPDTSIRDFAYRQLVRLRCPVEPNDIRSAISGYGYDSGAVVLELFRGYRVDELQSRLDWIAQDGSVAYCALALSHFQQWEDHVRADLSDAFSAFESKSMERLREQYGKGIDRLLGSRESLNEFIRSNYIVAALKGLTEHGRADDVEFARRYIGHEADSVKRAAMALMSRFAEEEDLELLITIASDNRSPDQLGAAKTAIRLAPGFDTVALLLERTTDREIVSLAIRSVWSANISEGLPLFEPLLSHTDVTVRKYAVAYITGHCSREESEAALERYLALDSYYYNVVCWFDRVLYAPSPLRLKYRARLHDQLGIAELAPHEAAS